MIAAYQAFWTRAFDFSGRTKRSAFWFALLDNLIISVILAIITSQISFFGVIYNLFFFAVIIPTISLIVRRLRDAGKEWPWIFIGLVPIIGGIWLIVLYCQPSIPG